MSDEGGRLRRAVRRLTAETQELDDAELQKHAENVGATAIANCADRAPVTVYGTIKSLTIRPRAGVPALEADVYDGSGVVTLVWLGRRTIVGLSTGRRIRARGRITSLEGRRLMYNPRYELVAD